MKPYLTYRMVPCLVTLTDLQTCHGSRASCTIHYSSFSTALLPNCFLLVLCYCFHRASICINMHRAIPFLSTQCGIVCERMHKLLIFRQWNTSMAALNTQSWIKFALFDRNHCLSLKLYNIGLSYYGSICFSSDDLKGGKRWTHFLADLYYTLRGHFARGFIWGAKIQNFGVCIAMC